MDDLNGTSEARELLTRQSMEDYNVAGRREHEWIRGSDRGERGEKEESTDEYKDQRCRLDERGERCADELKNEGL